MYAIIADGSHQYRVEQGKVVWFQSKNGAEPGKQIEFPVLLLVDGNEVRIGTPHVQGAKVVGEVVEHGRADKVRVFKYRRRENYHKTIGHRQDHTAVRITEIVAARK
jgi:large subunit ribosomal protein L21